MRLFNLKKNVIIIEILMVIIFNNTYAQNLENARFLARSEQYDEAELEYKQLIAKEPNNSKAYFFYGENYLLQYFADTISNSMTLSFKQAKELFEKGIQINPKEPLNYIGLAKIAYYIDDNQTAIDMREKSRSLLLPYKKISKIKPSAPVYAFTLAKIAESYIKDNNVDTSHALPLIREALRIDSKNRDIFLILGDIYFCINDGSNSVANYNRAQYCDPQSPTAKMKIGKLYLKAGSLKAAIPYFEEAIALSPNYAPAYRELGQLYSLAGKYDKSKEYFKKYLEITQGNIPAKIRYVTALFYAREYDEVVKNVEEIIAIDKSKVYMYRLAGYSCLEMDTPNYSLALSYMDTLFEKVPEDQLIKKDYFYLAKILLGKNQNYQDLVKENQKLKDQLDEYTKVKSEVSLVQKQNIQAKIDSTLNKIELVQKYLANADRDFDKAFAAYQKFISFSPANKNLINDLALNYYRVNRFNDAANTWASIITLGNDNINNYMQVAKAWYMGENYILADSMFDIIKTKFSDQIEGYIYSARTNAKMDPNLESNKAYTKFTEVLEFGKTDSIKYSEYFIEAFNYLGYYNLVKGNFNKSKEFYYRMINFEPANTENKVKGYNGLGAVDIKMAGYEPSNEGKIAALGRAKESYKKILSIDPGNVAAISTLKYIQDYTNIVKKGINQNELKGIVKTSVGQPIQYASVRVKDTAAEVYTNAKGEFKFEIPMGSEMLIVSIKGFKTKEIPITRPLKPLTITLEQE